LQGFEGFKDLRRNFETLKLRNLSAKFYPRRECARGSDPSGAKASPILILVGTTVVPFPVLLKPYARSSSQCLANDQESRS